MRKGFLKRSLVGFISLFCISVVLSAISSCDQSSNEIRTGNVRIVEGGQRFPLEIPPEFKYPGAEMVFSSSFEGSSFWTRPETTASLRSADSLNAVANYYQASIEQSGWTIIQSRRNSNAVLYMAESGYKNLLTIIIRPELSGNDESSSQESPNPEDSPAPDELASETPGPTLVKLYLKQSGAE